MKKIINHSGTIYGAQLTLHGKIRNVETTERYQRLPRYLLEQEGDDITHITSPEQRLFVDSAGLYFSFETDSATLTVSGQFAREITEAYASESGNVQFINGSFDLYRLCERESTSGTRGADNAGETSSASCADDAGSAPGEIDAGEWQYVGTVRGTPATSQKFSGTLQNINSGNKNVRGKFLLLFPMYNGIKFDSEKKIDLRLDVDAGCYFADAEFMHESERLPILIYGTSITQGASPDRVGNAYAHQVMLKTKHEIINMGFSGGAWMSDAMTSFLATIPASVCFIDPTMNHKVANIETCVGKYRAAHPQTPIVLVSQFDTHRGATEDSTTEMECGEMLKACYEKSRTAGDKNIYFISRLNPDGTAFVPSCSLDIVINPTNYVHPDTEGMTEWARRYLEMLSKI